MVARVATLKALFEKLWGSARGTPNRQALTRGSLGTMLVRGSSFLLILVASLLLARYLGLREFGIYSEALAWGSVIAVFGTLGLDRFAVREVSASAATSSWSVMRGLIRYLPQFALAFSLLVLLLATSLLFVFRDPEDDEIVTFVVAVTMAPLMSLSVIRQGMLQGLGRVVISCLPEDIIRPGLFILVLIVAFGFFGMDPDSGLAMGFQAGALLTSFLVGIYLLRRYVPRETYESEPMSLSLDHVRDALPIGLYAMANILLMQAGIVLLGLTSDPSQVALFATSFKVAVGVGLAEYAINNAYQPMVSSKLAVGDIASVERLAPRAAAASLVLTLPLALVVFVFADPILSLFGNGFDAAETTLRVLAASYVISQIFGQNGALLTMSRNVKPLIGGTVFALALNVVLNLTLTPEVGAEGAALAWLITLTAWNLVLGMQVRRHLGFWASPLVLLGRDKLAR